MGKRCENGRIPNEKKRREQEEKKKKKRSWYKHFSVDRASPGIFSRPFTRFNPLFEAAPHPSAYRYSSGAISPGHFSISSDEFPVPLSLPATSTRPSIYTANSPEHKSGKFLLFNVLFFLFEGGQQPGSTYQMLTRSRERGWKLDETKFLTWPSVDTVYPHEDTAHQRHRDIQANCENVLLACRNSRPSPLTRFCI